MKTTINLRLITDAILLRWRIIALAVIVMPTITVVASRFYRPPYEASARLMIQDDRQTTPILNDLTVDLQVGSRLPVVRNILVSRTNVLQMLRTLGEIDESSSQQQINGAVGAFQGQISVESPGGGVIAIDMQGGTPEEAVSRLRLVMQVLVEELLRPQKESLDASVQFLETQLARIAGELGSAEDRIRAFKEEHAEELPEVFEGNLNRYLETLAELQQAEADLAVAERRLDLSEEELAQYAYNPRLQQIEADLIEARANYENLIDTYTTDHPRVVRAQRRIRALEDEIEEIHENPEVTNIADLGRLAETRIEFNERGDSRVVAQGMLSGELLTHRAVANEVESLRYRIDRLLAQRDELREMIRSYAGNEQLLNELIREVEAKSALHMNLLSRYQDALLTRELTLQNEASRVWTIQAPSLPSAENRVPVSTAAVVGLFLALMIAGGLIFLAEYLDGTLRLPADAQEIAGVPTVVVLPDLHRHES